MLLQASRQEVITGMGGAVKELLIEFYRANRNTKPERLVMYRDGVSEGQFEQVLDQEYAAIRKASGRAEGRAAVRECSTLRHKALGPNSAAPCRAFIPQACAELEAGYRPSITFVVVQKRHNTRLLPADEAANDSKCGGRLG